VVWAVGDTLFGLHKFPGGDVATEFDEHRIGLDHVAFAASNRAELEKWETRLNELDIAHGGIKDASYGSGLSFATPTIFRSSSSPRQCDGVKPSAGISAESAGGAGRAK
jgi:hypothetical protein